MIEISYPPASSDALIKKTREANIAPARKPNHQNPVAWLDEKYNSTRGETSLWVAVIAQAMIDALSRCKKTESRYHKHEAINWLTSGGKDFVEVCLCADMDPAYVRKKAKQALVAPVAWRAEAGKGKRYLQRKAYREKCRAHANKESPAPVDDSERVIAGPWASTAKHD